MQHRSQAVTAFWLIFSVRPADVRSRLSYPATSPATRELVSPGCTAAHPRNAPSCSLCVQLSSASIAACTCMSSACGDFPLRVQCQDVSWDAVCESPVPCVDRAFWKDGAMSSTFEWMTFFFSRTLSLPSSYSPLTRWSSLFSVLACAPASSHAAWTLVASPQARLPVLRQTVVDLPAHFVPACSIPTPSPT